MKNITEHFSSEGDSSEESIFREFLGQEVKAPYTDGNQHSIARGKLERIEHGFLKIAGRRGTIIINQRNIVRMTPGTP